MKLKWLLGLTVAGLFIALVANAAAAQEEPPVPYAGLKNPFPWEDASAQAAGNTVYKQLCLGCHGIAGDNVAAADFSKVEFSQSLQNQPDFYFWVISEGRLAKGMPPFKSALSEQQLWQLITYLDTQSKAAPPVETAPPPGPEVKGSVSLAAPVQAESGKPLSLTATLLDEEGKPIPNATVNFFLNVDFFAKALMDIGSAKTDSKGESVIQYLPLSEGTLDVIARYGSSQDGKVVNIAGGVDLTYVSEVGIEVSNLGPKDIIYPKSVLDLGPDSSAPLPAFRLPGGILSWILLLVGTIFMIWFTYARVLYQIYRIPVTSEIKDVNTRLIPTIGLIFVISVGVVLILKLLISPYTHLNIPLS